MCITDYLLYASTSHWVLHIPSAGRNMLCQSFAHEKYKRGRKRQKREEKEGKLKQKCVSLGLHSNALLREKRYYVKVFLSLL